MDNKKTMADSLTEDKLAELRAHNKKTMAASLTEERKAELREAFSEFDSNNDGLITKLELENGMKKLRQNPTKAELEDMISEVDVDGDGYLDFDEFLSLIAKGSKDKWI